MAKNDSITSANANEVQVPAEKTLPVSVLDDGKVIMQINADILKANIQAAKDTGDIPGVRVLESGRNTKTSIICGKNNHFIEGKRVTILVIEE